MNEELRGAIEAILYIAGDPMSVETLAQVLKRTELEVDTALRELQMKYQREKRGMQIQMTEYGAQMCTNRAYAKYIQQLLRPDQTISLSDAILETLSIVAYKQPITRGEIEAVRGVSCDYAVNVLLNKRLIKPVGRKDTLGKPMQYGTTHEFLQHFGLDSLGALPAVNANDTVSEEPAEAETEVQEHTP